LPSNGLHTNGYSLARKLLFEQAGLNPGSKLPQLPGDLADELLKVHRSYLKPLQALQQAKLLKAAAHITGGGLTDNVPRVLPPECAAEIRLNSWPKQPIFEVLHQLGKTPTEDLRRTFNLGVGMVLIVGASKLETVAQQLKKLREPFYEIGTVVPAVKSKREPRVRYL
jgi:phosphoribosylformylglycinamidine cyclo-ligase